MNRIFHDGMRKSIPDAASYAENNAERLALRLSEATGEDHAVVRTECLQLLRVMPSHGHDPATFELQVILL